MGFPSGSVVKNLPANEGDTRPEGSIPGLGRSPGAGSGLPWCFRWWNVCLPMWETQVRSLGWEDPLEKEMATHSSTLAWKIPWTEEPGRLQSVGLQRVTTEQLKFHFHFPGAGNGNQLWYCCLENSMDRGAWHATVHRVAKNQTQPSTSHHMPRSLSCYR